MTMHRRTSGIAATFALMFSFASAAVSSGPAHAETAELRFAYQHSMAFLVVDVLLAKKFVETRAAAAGVPGLKVSAIRFASGPAANEALLKGDVDVGGAGVAPFLDLWVKTRGSANVRGVAPINNSPLYLITTDPRIQAIKDLGPSDKIAVPAPGSIQGLYLRMLADRTHGNAAYLDSTMASMTSIDALKALAAPDTGVRTYVGSIPFNLSAMALPGARELATSYTTLGDQHTLVLLFVTEKFKVENPKTYAALAGAIDDAMAFIKSNPKETAEIFAAASGGATPVERVMAILARADVAYDATPRGTMAFAQFMLKIGALKIAPDTWKDAYWENVHLRDGS